MNDTSCVPLVDTTRGELRSRIRQAGERFDGLVRSADPHARPPGHAWTVQQIAVHVLTVAHRYQHLARGLEYVHAASPSVFAAHNQTELDAAMAPVPDVADKLVAMRDELDAYFDTIADTPRILPFHAFSTMSGVTAQTNWLGELLLHGDDIAAAMNADWELPERDMLLVARGLMEVGPAYLRSEVPATTDVCVALQVPQAREFVVRIRDGLAEMRPRRVGDRPDAVLRVSAVTLTQLFYQRIGSFGSVRRGLRIVGGRRPWVALKLMSHFERA